MICSKTSSKSEYHPPIFIVGAPRSGTTLLSRIVGRHQDVASFGESNFFEDIWTRRRELGTLSKQEELSKAMDHLFTLYGRYSALDTQKIIDRVLSRQILLDRFHELGGDYRALYLALTRSLLDCVGKRRFCDDTPKHLYYLDAIWNLFPHAKVLGCVRDPRDFLCSYKNYWQSVSEGEKDRIKALYHPVLTSLLWRGSVNTLCKYVNSDYGNRITLVQYEVLVSNPSKEVKRICSFLDLPYSDNLLKVQSSNSSFSQQSSGVYTSSVGQWPSCLESEELWWNQTLNKRKMRELEYDFFPARTNFVKAALAILTLPFAVSGALRANRRKRGSLCRYVIRRIGSLVDSVTNQHA